MKPYHLPRRKLSTLNLVHVAIFLMWLTFVVWLVSITPPELWRIR